MRPSADRESISGAVFDIKGGRHPVVEAALKAGTGDPFVANDCAMGDERSNDSGGGAAEGVAGGEGTDPTGPTDPDGASRIWLLTGPNMAGKSTFLRQNALIVILAQMGSFVPAVAAALGVVDRVFSRVGAADDLARGRSTFMVEMVETATILDLATERSFVILDEIGRGTSTYDGLSIAWATMEYIHKVNRCRTIFATHYHELTTLADRLDQLSCHTMRVKEWRGNVVFLHEVANGAADRSYGLHVAKLAGLPSAVLKRAQEILHRLEASEQSIALRTLVSDLPLFQAGSADPDHGGAQGTAVEHELAAMNIDEMTPRAALEALYRLRGLLDE